MQKNLDIIFSFVKCKIVNNTPKKYLIIQNRMFVKSHNQIRSELLGFFMVMVTVRQGVHICEALRELPLVYWNLHHELDHFHTSSLHPGCGRHSKTIVGLERTFGMDYLTQQKTIHIVI